MKFASILLLLFCLGFLPGSEGFPKSEIYENFENENFDDNSEDNSAFDKIQAINEKAEQKSGNKEEYFEGDIVKTKSMKEMIENRKRGAASNNKAHIWPERNGKHEIRYYISSSISSSRHRQLIYNATQEWVNKVPCLRFVQLRSHLSSGQGYIYFFVGSGCWSYVGFQKRRQEISLGRGCMHHGIIVHEIGHALGFWHEQSRSDRDEYLTIHWENIQRGREHNFRKLTGQTDDKSHGYDYASIMQYGPRAFSRNGRNTITAKNGASIGQRQGLSDGDVAQAKTMYCGSKGGKGCKADLQTGRNCQSWKRLGYCQQGNRYAKYVLKHCCKTCSTGVTEVCTADKRSSDNCLTWKARGYCQQGHRYATFLKKNCCRTCSTGASEVCRGDRQSYRNCQYWRNLGYCVKKYVKYMANNCCKSCGFSLRLS